MARCWVGTSVMKMRAEVSMIKLPASKIVDHKGAIAREWGREWIAPAPSTFFDAGRPIVKLKVGRFAAATSKIRVPLAPNSFLDYPGHSGWFVWWLNGFLQVRYPPTRLPLDLGFWARA